MRIREADGRPVVELATASTISEVTGFYLDGQVTRIVGLRLGKRRNAVYVDWADVNAFGPDAVTVPDGTVLEDSPRKPPPGWTSADDRLLGRTVLTDEGEAIGHVVNVEFRRRDGGRRGGRGRRRCGPRAGRPRRRRFRGGGPGDGGAGVVVVRPTAQVWSSLAPFAAVAALDGPFVDRVGEEAGERSFGRHPRGGAQAGGGSRIHLGDLQGSPVTEVAARRGRAGRWRAPTAW